MARDLIFDILSGGMFSTTIVYIPCPSCNVNDTLMYRRRYDDKSARVDLVVAEVDVRKKKKEVEEAGLFYVHFSRRMPVMSVQD